MVLMLACGSLAMGLLEADKALDGEDLSVDARATLASLGMGLLETDKALGGEDLSVDGGGASVSRTGGRRLSEARSSVDSMGSSVSESVS